MLSGNSSYFPSLHWAIDRDEAGLRQGFEILSEKYFGTPGLFRRP